MLHFVLAAAIVMSGDTTVAHVDTVPVVSGPVRRATSAPSDTVRRRRSVELSDAYYTRLEIHRWGSYVELPLFAAEYVIGDKLMARGVPVANWVKPTHVALAATIAGVFGLNTITGGWNLYEGWTQLGDRKRLVVAHTVLMLAADGGFAGASLIAGNRGRIDAERRHRAVAVASMGLGTVSTVMMWIAKNR